MWIRVDGKLFFLPVLVKEMTRGDVGKMVQDFLVEAR